MSLDQRLGLVLSVPGSIAAVIWAVFKHPNQLPFFILAAVLPVVVPLVLGLLWWLAELALGLLLRVWRGRARH